MSKNIVLPETLIFEDEQDLRMFLESFVESEFKITTCNNAIKAKDLINTSTYDYYFLT